MLYPVAFGRGAKEYKTRGIPHSWLVGPGGKIVWKGHPAGLSNSIIEKHIAGARVGPKIFLPLELSKASRYIKASQFGKAFGELEKQTKRSKEASIVDVAREAMAQITKFSEDQYAAIVTFKENRQYELGLLALQRGVRDFKGMDISKKFDKEFKVWKKDKSIQAEMAGSSMLDEAKDLVKRGKYEKAAKIYATLVNSKKYAGSEAQKEAELRLQEMKRQ